MPGVLYVMIQFLYACDPLYSNFLSTELEERQEDRIEFQRHFKCRETEMNVKIIPASELKFKCTII